jgi:predicted GNAT superfamily acetyltransferase
MTGEIEIRLMNDYGEMVQAEALSRLVWPGSETDIIPAHLSLAISHNGGTVLGAFEGERLIGYVLGFLGTDSKDPERLAMIRLKHCSHQLGVDPTYRNKGIGFALKQAQRTEVVKQGIRLITWTYDPLLSQNAHLNIRRLGGVSNTYIHGAYGEMRDALNIGIDSDRFQVDWWVTSPRVRSRFDKPRKPLDIKHYLDAGAMTLNPAALDEQGRLHPGEVTIDPGGVVALVEIPSDFQALKGQDMDLAKVWREHSRHIFSTLFAAGYIITDFLYLRDESQPRSYYVLTHGEGTFG